MTFSLELFTLALLTLVNILAHVHECFIYSGGWRGEKRGGKKKAFAGGEVLESAFDRQHGGHLPMSPSAFNCFYATLHRHNKRCKDT